MSHISLPAHSTRLSAADQTKKTKPCVEAPIVKQGFCRSTRNMRGYRHHNSPHTARTIGGKSRGEAPNRTWENVCSMLVRTLCANVFLVKCARWKLSFRFYVRGRPTRNDRWNHRQSLPNTLLSARDWHAPTLVRRIHAAISGSSLSQTVRVDLVVLKFKI